MPDTTSKVQIQKQGYFSRSPRNYCRSCDVNVRARPPRATLPQINLGLRLGFRLSIQMVDSESKRKKIVEEEEEEGGGRSNLLASACLETLLFLFTSLVWADSTPLCVFFCFVFRSTSPFGSAGSVRPPNSSSFGGFLPAFLSPGQLIASSPLPWRTRRTQTKT